MHRKTAGSMYVTKQPKSPILSAETDAQNDSGVAKIEVTPEMIEAGRAELAGFDWVEESSSVDDVVVRIWAAMSAAAPSSESNR